MSFIIIFILLRILKNTNIYPKVVNTFLDQYKNFYGLIFLLISTLTLDITAIEIYDYLINQHFETNVEEILNVKLDNIPSEEINNNKQLESRQDFVQKEKIKYMENKDIFICQRSYLFLLFLLF